MAKKTDEKTLALIKEVKDRKAEIAKIMKPNWITNCSFSLQSGAAPTNLHVESDVARLIRYAGILITAETNYRAAAAALGVESVPDFMWDNSSVVDWLADIKSRINQVQIASKKKKLEALEARLNAVISPELRAEMELEAIEALLK